MKIFYSLLTFSGFYFIVDVIIFITYGFLRDIILQDDSENLPYNLDDVFNKAITMISAVFAVFLVLSLVVGGTLKLHYFLDKIWS